MVNKTKSKCLLCIHGLFYLVMGLWPILSLESFLNITGDKVERWLVITVSVILLAMSIGFLVESKIRVPAFSIKLIALLTSIALTIVDIRYVYAGTISTVYLMDAFIELLLAFAWIIIIYLEDYKIKKV
jgi:hypothetical protein